MFEPLESRQLLSVQLAVAGSYNPGQGAGSAEREQFLQHYHKRSNVESTMSMIKAKFRDHVRSKSDVAMKNEVLCKILCHNICCVIAAMYELGIQPVFNAPN